MALLSSVFGTALGSAAKVGSREIRESRERDRASAEQFKQLIQKQKAAYAEKQAAAKKKSDEVTDIAGFLQGQEGYDKFNSTELNDLAKELISLSGGDAAKAKGYFVDNVKEGKVKLIPQQIMAPTVTGATDIGLVDGRPQRPKLDVEIKPVSEIVEAQKKKEAKKGDVVSQTLLALSPVKKKGFFAEALTGKDIGTIQREALASLGMTEKDLQVMSESITNNVDGPQSAAFKILAEENDGEFAIQSAKEMSKTVLNMLNTADGAKLYNPNLTKDMVAGYKDVPVGSLAGLRSPEDAMAGASTVKEPIIKKFHPVKEFIRLNNLFLSSTNEDERLKYAKELLGVSAIVMNENANMQQTSQVSNAVKDLTNGTINRLKNLAPNIPSTMRDEINFDAEMADIDRLTSEALLLQATPGASVQAINKFLELNQKATELFRKIRPFDELSKFKDKHKNTIKLVNTLEASAGLMAKFPTDKRTEYTEVIYGGENIDSLSEQLNQALEDKNEAKIDAIHKLAARITGELQDASPGGKQEEINALRKILTEQFTAQKREETGNLNATLDDKEKERIEDILLNKMFNNGVTKKVGKDIFMLVPSRNAAGGTEMKRIPISIKVDGSTVNLLPGQDTDDYQKSVKTHEKMDNALVRLGRLETLLDKNGLILGGTGEFINTVYNTVGVFDELLQATANIKILKNFTNPELLGFQTEAQQITTQFISAAKDELFDDPRLSDQDLSLVIKYISVLNTPANQTKFISKAQAAVAIAGLRRIFLKQRVLRALDMLGKTGAEAFSFDDFTTANVKIHKFDDDGMLIAGATIQKSLQMVNLEKDSLARNIFVDLLRQRGLNAAAQQIFGRFEQVDDPNRPGQKINKLVGLDYEKMKNYFNEQGGGYRHNKNRQLLVGPQAANELMKDLAATFELTHQTISEVSGYGVVGDPDRRFDAGANSGAYGVLSTNVQTEGYQIDTDAYDENVANAIRILGQDTYDRMVASGRKFYGVRILG